MYAFVASLASTQAVFVIVDVWGFNQCKRTETAMEMVPDCFADTHCENGGTAVYETNVCWCECPEDWQGDSDCSKPTMPYKNLPEGSDICKCKHKIIYGIKISGNMALALTKKCLNLDLYFSKDSVFKTGESG